MNRETNTQPAIGPWGRSPLLVLLAVALALATGACGQTQGPVPTSTNTSAPPGPATNTPTSVPTDTPSATATPGPERMLRGVSLSPRSYEGADFTEFLTRAGELDILRWAGDWRELGGDNPSGAVVTNTASQYDFEAMIDTGVYSASSHALIAPLDNANQQAFVDTLATFAGEHTPGYLGVGVEVNIHHEDDPESFDIFVDLFDRAYDAIKAASPETQVYVAFQLERLRGLRGGLFGGTNDPSSADWDLIDRFPKTDFVAFTTYPGLVYQDPAEIPDDYYAAIVDHTDKPIAFTELGWSSETVAPGWESDEDAQARFAERFLQMTAALETKLAIWLWLYKQPVEVPAPFQGMSLLHNDGTPKPAWDHWKP